MRFVLRVVALLLGLSLTPALSQSSHESSRVKDLLSAPNVFDLPNAPAPQALDGMKLSGEEFMMPSTQPVSTAATNDPPVFRPAFVEATHVSFNRPAYLLVGVSSLITEAQNVHPELGKGMAGFTAYYWREFVDRTDANYWVIFALPPVFHEDEHFRVMQRGRKFYRLIYAGSRVLIARDYHNRNTINAAELLGRGAAQAISMTYYPRQDRSVGVFGERYGYALLGAASTNIFREFRADLETHVLHRRL